MVTGLYSPDGSPEKAKTLVLGFRLETYPEFSFDKMATYAINAIFRSRGEFNRAALRVIKGMARPMARGSIRIPGNADIELLDTFNKDWLIVSISHSIDTQAKTFFSDLALEYIRKGDIQGQAAYLPLPISQ